ncbi:hypothetical protein PQX77_009115 [Marasmius sp. AFHP31]|nr:hypothetical protein PQX77_009115 [Marasmius sp. AFHP31]
MSTLLCLACSSCLPPRSSAQKTFYTPCCQQPICAACISSNPRLTRYNPCLLCLAGVDAVGAKAKADVKLKDKNVDGSVRDEDTFVLVDDDDDDDDEQIEESTSKDEVPVPAEPVAAANNEQESQLNQQGVVGQSESHASTAPPRQAQYHIKRGDTLQGIIFKFAVNREELCRLNRLPLSTLTTTPHLLHTRTVLLLPSSARITGKENISFVGDPPTRTEEDEERAVRRARERAEKRLQTVTKEVDWAIAKAYVAVAEIPGEEEAYAAKAKEDPTAKRRLDGSSLEAVAVDRYLDDLEWEANELKAGRGVSIPSIPQFLRKS